MKFEWRGKEQPVRVLGGASSEVLGGKTAMLAAEWSQSSASSAAFIARPPPTWKGKLTGVIVGVIIFGILCSAGAYVATLEKTENKHGAQNIRSCSDMGMMMEQNIDSIMDLFHQVTIIKLRPGQDIRNCLVII